MFKIIKCRNTLLSGNVVKNEKLNENILLHLIGFVLATNEMVNCIGKLELFQDSNNIITDIKLLDCKYYFNIIFKIKFSK